MRRLCAYQMESTESKPLDAQDLFLKFARRSRPTTDDKHTQSTRPLKETVSQKSW
jgi:hypothetical protein